MINCNIIFHNSAIKQSALTELDGSAPSSTQTDFNIDANPAPGSPFHLAIPVHSMIEARKFYGDILGLKEGRRSDNKW